MFDFPISYEAPVFRPPSEGRSFLLQVTIGCSNNKCTYCSMYRTKKFRVRKTEEILKDLEEVKKYNSKIGFYADKVFLCDGDALSAPMEVLIPVLDKINELFPECRRIGTYATGQNMLEKTPDQLKLLAEKKLNLAYLGLESGNNEVLHMVVKGNTAEEMLKGSLKIKKAGWQLSVISMLGLGGRKLSASHVKDTGKIVTQMSPHYFSFLTTVPVPGTPYHKMVEKKLIDLLTTKELLREMHGILKLIKPQNNVVFRSNHVSNMYPVGGTLPGDQDAILDQIDSWIEKTPDDVYPEIDPHHL